MSHPEPPGPPGGGPPELAPFEPEPEGGPAERQRQFLTERLTPLRPKDEGSDAGDRLPAAPPPDLEIEGPARSESRDAPAPPPPESPRQRALEDYRQRLGAHEGHEPQPPEAADERDDPGSRMPPVPPPANNWVPIGPSVLRQGQADVKPATAGRTPGIAVASGGTRVYAATANGGVWRSDDTGVTWRSTMDAFDLNQPNASSDSLACGAIAIDPTNPDRVFVGTGEGAGGAYFGVGPVFSSDGGTTWAVEPVAAGSLALAGSAFYALAVDPGNTDRVVAATRRGVYRRESAATGFHWARKAVGTSWATSVVAARSGSTTTFYAAIWGGQVFSSTDGHTWAAVGIGFPTTNVGRIALAVRAIDPTVVYALVHNSSNHSVLGVWRLDTTAGTWRQATGHPTNLFGPPGGGQQGWYDIAIAVDPNDANRIYLGGSTVFSGTDWSGSVFRCTVTVTAAAVTLAPTFIGNSVHADIHTLVFAPGDSNKLWVGCDGGVFYSTNPTGAGNLFEPRNTGLQTLMMNHLGQHPTEDAVVFGGTQDNGGIRFTGEEAWLYSSGGDGGFAIVNWSDPYRVLSSYVSGSIRRSTDGGSRYAYANVNVPLGPSDRALFYAPYAGTRANPAAPAEAERVAFGSNRVWISDAFGGAWTAVTPFFGATDDFSVRSLAFASADRVYAGLVNGQVHRVDRGAAGWTATRIDNVGAALGLTGPITDIAVDTSDITGASIYVAFGGVGDWRHVWRFDGTGWQARSGPSAAHANSLLDIQHNALVVDPANAGHVYVGADLGIWRSTDGGLNWAPFSEGLPDAAVLDLTLHQGRRLLRAATHGRSVFERTLNPGAIAGVELYIRDTQLDQGRFTTTNFLPDPTRQGETVRHWAGPDIKLDTPDAAGNYQFPITPGTTIDFHQFVDKLTDDFRNVAVHATATITTRVYVQVHNRGVTKADDVKVSAYLANASAGLPPLPTGFDVHVRAGTDFMSTHWRYLGTDDLDDVRVGFPKIAAFELPSNYLPPVTALAGNDHHCVLALVHHTDDPFTATQTHTDTLSLTERKSAHKNLKVVQFTGTVPPAVPLIVPIRFNPGPRGVRLSRVLISLGRYTGRVRIYAPPLRVEGDPRERVKGAEPGEDFEDFTRWAKDHMQAVEKNQASEHPYDKEWTREQLEELDAALNSGLMFTVSGKSVTIDGLALERNRHQTLFLAFDRPARGKLKTAFPIEIRHLDERGRRLIGGITVRVELVPAPRGKQDADADMTEVPEAAPASAG